MIALIIFKIVGIPFESPHLLHLCFVLINQSRPAKPLIGAMLDGVRKDFKRCDWFPEFETCWSNSMWTDVFGYKQKYVYVMIIIDQWNHDTRWYTMMRLHDLNSFEENKSLVVLMSLTRQFKYFPARLGAQTVKELHEDLYTMKTRWGPWFPWFSNGGGQTEKMQMKYILSNITSGVWDMNWFQLTEDYCKWFWYILIL